MVHEKKLSVADTFQDTGSTTSLPSLDLEEARRRITQDNEWLSPPQSPCAPIVSVVRVCLHGSAVVPDVQLCPSTLEFGAVPLGKTERRVMRISNNCPIQPIHFKYRKALHFGILPAQGNIGPSQAVELTVIARPSKYGAYDKWLKIDIFGRRLPDSQDTSLVKIDYSSFRAKFDCPAKPCGPAKKPEFNMGISPMLTNEVGKLTDDIKFGSSDPKPWASMLRADVYKTQRWLKNDYCTMKCKKGNGISLKMFSSKNMKSAQTPTERNSLSSLHTRNNKLNEFPSKTGTDFLQNELGFSSASIPKQYDSTAEMGTSMPCIQYQSGQTQTVNTGHINCGCKSCEVRVKNEIVTTNNKVTNMESKEIHPVAELKDQDTVDKMRAQCERSSLDSETLTEPPLAARKSSSDTIKENNECSSPDNKKLMEPRRSSSDKRKVRDPQRAARKLSSDAKKAINEFSSPDTKVLIEPQLAGRSSSSDTRKVSDERSSPDNKKLMEPRKSSYVKTKVSDERSSPDNKNLMKPKHATQKYSVEKKSSDECSSHDTKIVMEPQISVRISSSNSKKVSDESLSPDKIVLMEPRHSARRSSCETKKASDECLSPDTKVLMESQLAALRPLSNTRKASDERSSPDTKNFMEPKPAAKKLSFDTNEASKGRSSFDADEFIEPQIAGRKSFSNTRRASDERSSSDNKNLMELRRASKKLSFDTNEAIDERSLFDIDEVIESLPAVRRTSYSKRRKKDVRSCADPVQPLLLEYDISSTTSIHESSRQISPTCLESRRPSLLKYPRLITSHRPLSEMLLANEIPPISEDVVSKNIATQKESEAARRLAKRAAHNSAIPATSDGQSVQRRSIEAADKVKQHAKTSAMEPTKTLSNRPVITKTPMKIMKQIVEGGKQKPVKRNTKKAAFKTVTQTTNHEPKQEPKDSVKQDAKKEGMKKTGKQASKEAAKQKTKKGPVDKMDKKSESTDVSEQDFSDSTTLSKLTSEVTCVFIEPVPFENTTNRQRKCLTLEKMIEKECSKNPQDALIAFPNDRAGSLRRWPSDKIARTIFTGIPRYSCPVDREETHTPAELRRAKFNEQVYLRWMRTYGAYSRAHQQYRAGDTLPLPEYEVDDEKLYQMLGMQPCKISKKRHDDQIKLGPSNQIFMPLTPLQLYNISVSPRFIDFGEVAPCSNNIEKLRFQNLNTFQVLIRMLQNSSSITYPEGDNQIIGPGDTKYIPIVYNSLPSGRFTGCVEYEINHNHTFKVVIAASVVSKTLNVDKTCLVFGQTPIEEAFQHRTEFITITNTFQAGCRFCWSVADKSVFTVTPTKGEVPAKSSLLCEVLYHPKFKLEPKVELILISESKSQQVVVCNRLARKYTVSFVNRTLDLPNIPLNLLRVYRALIYNASYEDAPFTVVNAVPMSGCLVKPKLGVVRARSCFVLKLEMLLTIPMAFEFSVFLLVESLPKLELKVSGKVIYPKVVVTPDTVRFHRIRCDTGAYRELTVKNTGTVEAHIKIPMQDYPELFVSATPTHLVTPFDDDGKFILVPGKARPIYILLNPIDVATFELYLPIIINNMLGPPCVDNPASIKPEHYIPESSMPHSTFELLPLPARLPVVRVDCILTRKLLAFSSRRLEFLQYPGQPDRSLLEQQLSVVNEGHEAISFCIRTDDLNGGGSPFTLKYVSGGSVQNEENAFVVRLEPDEETKFEASFVPLCPGTYDVRVPVYVQGQGEGAAFSTIDFSGYVPEPCIECDVKKLFFPPVPLGESYGSTVTLHACHYPKNTEITAEVAEADKLSVHFTKSSRVLGNRDKVQVPVKINFRSDVATSLKTTVTFRDASHAAFCSIDVIATADNCSLTTHWFIYFTSDKYELDRIDLETASSINDLVLPRGYGGSPVDVTENPSPSCSSGEQTSSPDVPLEACRNVADLSSPSSLLRQCLCAPSSSVNEQKMTFPPFPKLCTGLYPIHMLKTRKVVERWLYELGFQCAFQAKIPEGITSMTASYFTNPKTTAEKRATPFTSRSILNLLVNLAGPNVLKYFDNRPLPEEDGEERVGMLAGQYQQLLNLLTEQGAHLIHVQPELLLTYEEYLLYIRRNRDCQPRDPPLRLQSVKEEDTEVRMQQQFRQRCEISKEHDHEAVHKLHQDCPVCQQVPTEEEFYRLSRQAWLDVLLQIIKTLWLCKINLNSIRERKRTVLVAKLSSSNVLSPSSLQSPELNCQMDAESRLLDANLYSMPERILLAWLTNHYNRQRDSLWPRDASDEPPLPAKTIVSFHDDLSDGLVLAAVTASYCPYLVPLHFGKLCLSPKSIEQSYHNANCLLSAWRTIRLGFTVYCSDLVSCHPVFMLLLCAHLHSVLPTLYPRATLRFAAPLTTTVTRRVLFSNPSKKRVAYKAEILGDPNGFFALERPGATFYMASLDKVCISVIYKAKKIARVTATLVLAGATIAPNYARNFVFRLEGDLSSLQVSATFALTTPLYRPTSFTLPITPPFPISAEYEIRLSYVEPQSSDSFYAEPWRDLCKRKVPRRLYLSSSELSFDAKDAVASLNLTAACVIPTKRVFWLAFLHPTVGDFIVKLELSPKTTDLLRRLPVAYPLNWRQVQCHCVHPSRPRGLSDKPCDLRTTIKLPCRNKLLWNAVSTMFRKSLDDTERQFWASHMETNIGLRLIEWLMGDQEDSESEEFKHIFKVTVTYEIRCSQPNFIRMPEQITIPDVRLFTNIDLPIHVSNETPEPFSMNLTLKSLDSKETRNYRVEFSREPGVAKPSYLILPLPGS